MALIIILLGAGLRFYQLGQDGLWLDEIITQARTQRPVFNMLKWVWLHEEHPPLFYLLAYQNRILGGSDFAVRLTSVAAGILTIPVFIKLGRKFWGAPAGLLAGLLLALWPVHIHYSQEARQYALLMLFTSASMYWLYRSVTIGNTGAWFGYSIATICALYTHYFSFLWIISQVVFVSLLAVLFLKKRGKAGLKSYLRKILLPFVVSLLIADILFLPWAPNLIIQSRRLITGVSAPKPKDGAAFLAIIKGLALFFSGRDVFLKTGVWALMAIGFMVGALQRRWEALLLIIASLTIPLLMIGLISSPHFFNSRYLFPLLTPIILLVAEALHPLLTFPSMRFKFPRRVVISGATAIFLLVSVFFIPPIRAYYHWEKEGWHDAARYLQAHMSPNDIILADGMLLHKSGDAARVQFALGYYLPTKTILLVEKDAAQSLQDYPHPDAIPWVVLWYQHRLESRDALRPDIEIHDYHFLVILELKNPNGGDLMKDTTKELEALLQLQPLQESKPDVHAMLAEIYRALGDETRADAHARAAEQ